MPNNQIILNYIPDPDYARLVKVAKRLKISISNLVRRRLHIPDAKPGNPTGNKGKKINQPKGKKRKAKEQNDTTN